MSPKVTVITVELPETVIEHVGDMKMYFRVSASNRVPHKSDGELVNTNPFVGDLYERISLSDISPNSVPKP